MFCLLFAAYPWANDRGRRGASLMKVREKYSGRVVCRCPRLSATRTLTAKTGVRVPLGRRPLPPVPPLALDDPVLHILPELQRVWRNSVRLEGGLVGVNLDQQEKGRVVRFLVDVEAMAAGFRIEAD